MSWRERIFEDMNEKNGEGYYFGMDRTMSEQRKGPRLHPE
jgi:hypothetical protein